MAFDVIGVGSAANDGTGDTVRASFQKVNTNFGKAVEGPATATANRVAVYDGGTGKLLKDGSKLEADLVTGPASVTADRLAVFNSTTGKIIKEAAFTAADIMRISGFAPGDTLTPANNGEVVFELTDNTTLTIKAKGSDGTVRSVALTLAP